MVIPADVALAGRNWSALPLGTRALSCSGGWWLRVLRGWQWMGRWSVFPTPGGDALHVELPEEASLTA